MDREQERGGGADNRRKWGTVGKKKVERMRENRGKSTRKAFGEEGLKRKQYKKQ